MNCPVTCSKGWYSNGKVCAICPKNEYQDIAAQTSCQKCPAGKVTLGIGSTNSSQCINICTVPTIHFGEAYPPSGYEVFIFLPGESFSFLFYCYFHVLKLMEMLKLFTTYNTSFVGRRGVENFNLMQSVLLHFIQ